MEKMFHWCSMAYGLRYVSLRYFNACGAMENGEIGEAHTPETHLIPIVLQAAAGKRDRVLVYGNDYPTDPEQVQKEAKLAYEKYLNQNAGNGEKDAHADSSLDQDIQETAAESEPETQAGQGGEEMV